MKNNFLTLKTARDRSEAFIERISAYPAGYAGKGIVIPGGGLKYFTNAWVAVRMLRKLGCKLPIQIWHLGPEEIEERMRAIMVPYDVEFVDAYQVREVHPVRRLAGWELKPFSILHSRFEQVLLLDADNVPVVNPEFLFHTPQFEQTGAVFWPDFGHLNASDPIWDICGVPYRDEPEWESGEILVDKRKCWRALQLAMWYNEHSDFYYQYILGDKDTYHLAFRKLDQPVSMPATPVRALKWTLCQHDFEGNRIFQHRVGDKWSLERDNGFIWGFQYEADCRMFLEELQIICFGKKQRTPKFDSAKRSQRANEVAREITANVFSYERVGFDRRPLTFLPDGRIGQGVGICEAYWDLKEEPANMVLLISSKAELTCSLTKQNHGVWEGQWLHHERMPVILNPLHRLTPRLSLESNGTRTNGRRSKKSIQARLAPDSQGSFAKISSQISPILTRMGFDLGPSSTGVFNGPPSSQPIRMRISDREWNLLFKTPKRQISLSKRTVWFTTFNSLRLPMECIHSLNSAAAIIVPSYWNASSLSCLGITKPIWVVPPGVDSRMFAYSPVNLKGPCVFGMVAAECTADQVPVLEKTIRYFQTAFPTEKDVKLRIYSPGAIPISSCGESRVEVETNPLEEKKLARWFRELTCFLSTETPKGWPEWEHKALAMGKPLIGARFGGLSDFFSDEAGYPVEFNLVRNGQTSDGSRIVDVDQAQFAHQMRQVYKDRGLARQLGIQGRRLVSKFTWNNFCRQLADLVRSLEETIPRKPAKGR